MVEHSSKSDLLMLLDPAEEFINDVLEDFCSRLSDGTSSENILKHAEATVTDVWRLHI